jgi:BirA family transcriptional regulator, biotin operon repressor / biotin---[acetyl-CoA-carboxylase] ligase
VISPNGPPAGLVRSLLDGPSAVSGFDWHPTVSSTNELAAEAGLAGAPEIHVVAADVQTAGRGRLGRRWQAPPGTSLQCSWLLRPPSGVRLGLVPLMIGVALAQTVGPHCPGADVALKWPNDVLLDGGKCAGVLVEHIAPGIVVVGTGVNVDWRGVERGPGLEGATSLSEAAGAPVDRWRFFAGFAGVLSRRYQQVLETPSLLLADYRQACATLGREVRISVVAGEAVEGRAVEVDDEGALVIARTDGVRTTVHAGDVEHLRPR